MDRKERERQEKLARGEEATPAPKRRGRRPRTEEEKAAIKAAKKEEKKRMRTKQRMDKKSEKFVFQV